MGPRPRWRKRALGPLIAARANATGWLLGDSVVVEQRHHGERHRAALEAVGVDDRQPTTITSAG